MYAEDSLLTLGLWERIAVIALAAALALLTLALAWRAMRRQTMPIRLAIALIAFLLFVWLSPQVFYLLYIPMLGVPWQIVVSTPPVLDALRMLTFTGRTNLSWHGQGLLGWALIVLALIHPKLPNRKGSFKGH